MKNLVTRRKKYHEFLSAMFFRVLNVLSLKISGLLYCKDLVKNTGDMCRKKPWYQNTQKQTEREKKQERKCHVSCVTCHVSCVMYVSCVACPQSPVTNIYSHSHRPSPCFNIMHIRLICKDLKTQKNPNVKDHWNNKNPKSYRGMSRLAILSLTRSLQTSGR